jgi:hypothetical protein
MHPRLAQRGGRDLEVSWVKGGNAFVGIWVTVPNMVELVMLLRTVAETRIWKALFATLGSEVRLPLP